MCGRRATAGSICEAILRDMSAASPHADIMNELPVFQNPIEIGGWGVGGERESRINCVLEPNAHGPSRLEGPRHLSYKTAFLHSLSSSGLTSRMLPVLLLILKDPLETQVRVQATY